LISLGDGAEFGKKVDTLLIHVRGVSPQYPLQQGDGTGGVLKTMVELEWPIMRNDRKMNGEL